VFPAPHFNDYPGDFPPARLCPQCPAGPTCTNYAAPDIRSWVDQTFSNTIPGIASQAGYLGPSLVVDSRSCMVLFCGGVEWYDLSQSCWRGGVVGPSQFFLSSAPPGSRFLF